MNFSITGSKNFVYLPLQQISVNPNQPRKIFAQGDIDSLADSISRYGILSPLTVRRTSSGFQLIAGERRLRAATQAGLRKVPCFVVEAGEEESSLMALVENLQRRDLDPFEEAEGLLRLTRIYGMTQKEAAEKVGKTQPAVANKIRLLKLGPETVELVRKSGLSERHARTLLRLEDEGQQLAAAREIVRRHLNVEQTEQYVQRLLEVPVKRQRPKVILKDLRLFYNTVGRAVQTLQNAGLRASIERQEAEGQTRIVILVGQG